MFGPLPTKYTTKQRFIDNMAENLPGKLLENTLEDLTTRFDWEPEQQEPSLEKERLVEAVHVAMERTQVCPTIEQVQTKYLEHDPRAYRRVMRMLIDTNKQGKPFFFYSLRAYSVQEIDRLKKLGLNTKKDDVLFDAGLPSSVFQIEPHRSRISKAEQQKIDDVLVKYAEGVRKRQEEEKAKTTRPVIMSPSTGTVVEVVTPPAGALAGATPGK